MAVTDILALHQNLATYEMRAAIARDGGSELLTPHLTTISLITVPALTLSLHIFDDIASQQPERRPNL